jgi:hypothetical protein
MYGSLFLRIFSCKFIFILFFNHWVLFFLFIFYNLFTYFFFYLLRITLRSFLFLYFKISKLKFPFFETSSLSNHTFYFCFSYILLCYTSRLLLFVDFFLIFIFFIIITFILLFLFLFNFCICFLYFQTAFLLRALCQIYCFWLWCLSKIFIICILK